MAILGLGMDLVENERISQVLQRFGEQFLRRIMRPEELEFVPRPLTTKRACEYVAARFAAREAAVKALGTGFSGGVTLMDVQVVRSSSGKPEILFFGGAAQRAQAMGVRGVHLTLTHTRDYAAAVVVLEE